MSRESRIEDATQRPDEAGPPGDAPGAYLDNHVVGVIDTREEVGEAVEALGNEGFLDSEIHVVAGERAADALEAWSGRSGLITNLLIRAAEVLGIKDDEMTLREGYGQALRNSRYVIAVAAPTDTRRALATRLLGEHGGHGVAFLGRFAVERLIPPKPR